MNGGGRALRKFYVALLLAGPAALAGCADVRRSVSLPPVNPESPVAGQVSAAAPLRYDTPRLLDVPPSPRNVPEPGVVKAGVLTMVRCRRSVASYAPSHPALSAGAEQFAFNAREVAEVDPADVPPPDSSARTEDAAAKLRAYAAPPAALASGPPPDPDVAKPGGPPSTQPPPAAKPARRAPRPPARTAAATPPASAGPAPSAPAAEAPSAAAATQAATVGTAPPFPLPRPDPLLARCT